MLTPRSARFVLFAAALFLPIFSSLTWAQDSAQEATPKSLWADFNHYVRIAKPDLAQAAGASLLDKVTDGELVDIVESTPEYANYEQTLRRAARIETLADLARTFEQRIQAGRMERARDPQRIQADIELLAQGGRAQANAIARLQAAGQYAAPALLATLTDESQKRLHPYVQGAMVRIGRPLVYPLSVALPRLEPVPQGQVAQVLSEIGYPRALPYIKQVVEAEGTDANTRVIAQAAFDHLAQAARAPTNVNAAELFLTLGRNHYDANTRHESIAGFDPADELGIVWEYLPDTGLVPIDVPSQVFGDILAMRAAQLALVLNPQLDPALSLWLMSNLRRENNLKDGEVDKSYPAGLLEPMYYLKAAGPIRQHDVLDQALNDGDQSLALDAIAALGETAGTDALVNREGTVQPLIRALSYPDRRVRFAAAFTLTNARPKEAFPGSHSVVPVLAEALRQTDLKYAVVIGQDQESTNRKVAMLKELGYEPIGGTTLLEVAEAIAGKPGIDLILSDQSEPSIKQLLLDRTTDYKLAAVPFVALSSPGTLTNLSHALADQSGVFVAANTDASSELKAVVEQATASYAGAPITAELAHDYAATALDLLRQITLGAGEVFNVYDALPALIQATSDERSDIATKSAHIIALLDSPDGQRVVADAALDPSRTEELRIEMLAALAESANHIGNQLNEPQLDKLLELVKTSTGELGLAAARAHGALTLPTANVVQMLTKK